MENGELRCIPVALFWFIVNHLVLHLFFATVYNFSSNWLCCSEMLLYRTCVYNWSRWILNICCMYKFDTWFFFFYFFCYRVVFTKLVLCLNWIYKVMFHLPLPVIISFEYRFIISQSLSLFKHLQVNLFHF